MAEEDSRLGGWVSWLVVNVVSDRVYLVCGRIPLEAWGHLPH